MAVSKKTGDTLTEQAAEENSEVAVEEENVSNTFQPIPLATIE